MRYLYSILFFIIYICFSFETIADEDPSIKIINYSNIPTEKLISWTEYGTSKFSDWQADTLGIIYNIGKETRQGKIDVRPFNTHRVILLDDQIEEIKNHVLKYIQNGNCADDRIEDSKYLIEDIVRWIKGGADIATAPDPCYHKRMVLFARNKLQKEITVQQIWLHELYHAHSNYLQNYCIDPNQPEYIQDEEREIYEQGRWFGEATAEYFAHMVTEEMNGNSKPVSKMLMQAKKRAKKEGKSIYDDLAANSAVALRLIIERGNIEINHEDILSANVFHSCDWPKKWTREVSEEVAFAQDNWHKITKKEGSYVFIDSALK